MSETSVWVPAGRLGDPATAATSVAHALPWRSPTVASVVFELRVTALSEAIVAADKAATAAKAAGDTAAADTAAAALKAATDAKNALPQHPALVLEQALKSGADVNKLDGVRLVYKQSLLAALVGSTVARTGLCGALASTSAEVVIKACEVITALLSRTSVGLNHALMRLKFLRLLAMTPPAPPRPAAGVGAPPQPSQVPRSCLHMLASRIAAPQSSEELGMWTVEQRAVQESLWGVVALACAESDFARILAPLVLQRAVMALQILPVTPEDAARQTDSEVRIVSHQTPTHRCAPGYMMAALVISQLQHFDLLNSTRQELDTAAANGALEEVNGARGHLLRLTPAHIATVVQDVYTLASNPLFKCDSSRPAPVISVSSVKRNCCSFSSARTVIILASASTRSSSPSTDAACAWGAGAGCCCSAG